MIDSKCQHDIIYSFNSWCVRCASRNSLSILHYADGLATPGFDCSSGCAPLALDHSADRTSCCTPSRWWASLTPAATRGALAPPYTKELECRLHPMPIGDSHKHHPCTLCHRPCIASRILNVDRNAPHQQVAIDGSHDLNFGHSGGGAQVDERLPSRRGQRERRSSFVVSR